MIRISQQDSAKSAKSYYSTADYYTEGQELIGSWGGKAATRWGLSGPVDQASFDRLCDNLDPQTGEQLTVRTRSERTVGFHELDRLGWIKEVDNEHRNGQLAIAYLTASAERKKDGKLKTALVVSPTHAEAARITDAIRAGLKARGKIGDERIIGAWVPAHLTDAQKTDATQYAAGDLIQFQQNAPGFTKGSRVLVGVGAKLPTEQAERFEVYRPKPLALAKGDRIRITAGGKTKDGKHRLGNGALLNVQGFTKQGDIIADHGWVIDHDFGHLTHGYVATSHNSQGVTVDKVFVGISSQSLPATDERTAYVAITRGREKVEIFTDDKSELLNAMTRPDDPMSATELTRTNRSKKRTSPARGVNNTRADVPQATAAKEVRERQELDHAR